MNHRALVHAGLPPQWTVITAVEQAAEVEAILRGPDWQELFAYMYGDEPAVWSPNLTAQSRIRYTINALTRMRFLHSKGELEFSNTGAPDDTSGSLIPWFQFPARSNSETKIICGLWAALGYQQTNNVASIDSGCVWGGCLTALPVDPPAAAVTVTCER